MTPLERWSDDRLDDLARRVEEAMAIHTEVLSLKVQVATLVQQQGQCLEMVGQVRLGQEAAEKHREEREEVQRQERKSDRKWALATILTVLALVIAALGIFVG